MTTNLVTFSDFNFKKKKKKILKVGLPWIEKYRPVKMKDVILHSYIKIKFNNIKKTKDLPNLIIIGEPGTGKTSSILCLVKQLMPKKYYSEYVLELNASDDRGLSTINNVIIHFCKKKVTEVNHKIIILDEADSITPKAQFLLNNIIEEFYNNTRFIFICNDSTKITESIQSRCSIIRFPRLINKSIAVKLKSICESETINYTEKGLECLIFSSCGDIRQAINNLECVSLTYKKVTQKNVLKICDKPKAEIIFQIFDFCKEKNLIEAMTLTNELIDKGYSANDILLTMVNLIIYDPNFIMKTKNKILFLKIISIYYMKINEVIESNLQLNACIAQICNKI